MISIIIPAYNEQGHIGAVVDHLQALANRHNIQEIIVVDGGSVDNSVAEAQAAGALVLQSGKGRARQMNYGAEHAKGCVLYFLHADSTPPATLVDDILAAVRNGYGSGCYRLAFDYDHWFLKANCWVTRFDLNAVRFGDQSLFVTKDIFAKAGGFREDMYVMEDQEIIHRLKKYGKFTVMDREVITSARKYHDNGLFRMQVIFFRIWFMYYLGYSQEQLLQVYRKLIRKHKL